MSEEQAVKPKKQKEETLLTFKEKITYLISQIGFQEALLAIENYMLYFYTDVLMIGAGIAGLIGTIVTVFDAINDPLIGHYTSNHKSKKGESIRQHLLYAAVPFAVFYALLWFAPQMPVGLKVAYALLVRCALSVFKTFISIPMVGMLHLCSPLQHDRTVMGEFNSIGCLIGYALSVIGLYPLVLIFGGGANSNGTAMNERRGFLLMGILCAVVGAVTILLYYFSSQERVHDEKPDEKVSFRKSFSVLFKDRHFRRINFFVIIANLTDASILATMTYYCKYIVGNAALIIPIFATMLVVGGIATPFCEKIVKKMGPKGLLILGQGVCVIIAQTIVLLKPDSVPILMVCGALHGIKLGLFNTAFPLDNVAATDKLAAQNDGKRSVGMFLMFGGLVKKFGYALTTLFIGLGLKWGGYDGSLDVQSPGALMALKILFIYIPLFFGILCLYYSIRRMDFEKE